MTRKSQLEEAGIHKSAKMHAGSFLCLVALTFDILTPK